MEERKVIIIGAGFSQKQIKDAIGYSNNFERGLVIIRETEYTQPPEIKLTELEISSALESYAKTLEEIAKKHSKVAGIDWEPICTALQNLSISNNQSIQRVKDLSVSFNDIKPTYMYEEPKSKYINKPRNNYKRR